MGSTSTGIGVLFAATYPERCAGLIIFDPQVKGTRTDDYPWAPTEEEWREELAAVRAGWGERGYLEDLALAAGTRGRRRRRLSRLVRLAHAPKPQSGRGADGVARRHGARRSGHPRRGARAHARHRASCACRDRATTSPSGFGEQSSPSCRPSGASTRGPTTRLTRRRWRRRRASSRNSPAESRPERVLATILFTDIVGSTERAATLGDSAWRQLLERHHAVVRRELGALPGSRARHGGRRLLRRVRRAGASRSRRVGDP